MTTKNNNQKQSAAEAAAAAVQKAENSSAVTQRKQPSIFEMIEKQRTGFALALPENYSADRFTRVAITALKTNPKLASCEPMSLLGALMLSAQLGLEPNSPLHEAALIPYGNQVQFIIEYRGLLKLVWNSGQIKFLDFDKVHENDEFIYSKGFNPEFIHKPLLKGDRGAVIAYYAQAELKSGGKVIHVMTKDEVIQHAKKFSKSFSSGPWKTDFDAMAFKTVLKQLADKKLPKSTTDITLNSALTKDESKTNISAAAASEATKRKIEIEEIQSDYSFDDADDADAEVIENQKEKTKTEGNEDEKLFT